jgi:uracil-DNA glycosylase
VGTVPGLVLPVTTSAFQTLHDDIRACRRCVEAGFLPQAFPVFRGREDNVRMLVGQAPGPRAQAADVPWSGASGRLLRSWFAQAGFDPERFLDDWYLTSLTKCFPGKATRGPGDRVPSSAERALCRSHLDREIALVRPRVMVTVGRLSSEAIIPDVRRMRLDQVVGRVYIVELGYGPVPVVPLPHPSGVGRWLNSPANRTLVEQGLRHLAEVEQ